MILRLTGDAAAHAASGVAFGVLLVLSACALAKRAADAAGQAVPKAQTRGR